MKSREISNYPHTVPYRTTLSKVRFFFFFSGADPDVGEAALSSSVCVRQDDDHDIYHQSILFAGLMRPGGCLVVLFGGHLSP